MHELHGEDGNRPSTRLLAKSWPRVRSGSGRGIYKGVTVTQGRSRISGGKRGKKRVIAPEESGRKIKPMPGGYPN